MQSCKGTYLLFILVILFSLSAFSQIPERPNAYDSSGSKHGEWVMFYDSGFVNILPDTVGARYFRLATFERGKPVGLVRDYYLSGILQWKGNMLSIDPDTIHGESIQYNPSGTIQARHQFKFGKLDGPVTEYYETGELLLESAYKNGKLSGTYRRYAKNGKIVTKGQLVDGKMEGYFEFYHPNGQLETKGNYKNDINDGYFEFYYPNGNLYRTANFENGVQTGKYVEYYESGKVYSESEFVNGEFTGSFKRYFENGQLDEVGIYKDSERDGYFKFYHENGQLQSEGNYENGVDTGYWKYYYDNGIISKEGSSYNGLWNGYVKEYDRDGNLTHEGNYVNGESEGAFRYYYPSGKIENIIHFEDGEKTGPFEYYSEHGDLVQKGSFKNGNREDYWEFYHENGQILMKANFKDDAAFGDIVRYYSNGNLETKGYYENGVKQGLHIDYFENGNIKNKGEFVDGNRQGYTQFYHDNGQLYAEGDYENGNSSGYWKYYSKEGVLTSEGVEYGDLREGVWKYYYPNGQLKKIGPAQKNILNGWWKYYDEDGNLTDEGSWKDDLQDSIWTGYHENGRISSQGNYDRNLKNGKWVYYFEDGSLDEYITYDRGTRLNYYNLYDSIINLSYRREWDRVDEALKQVKEFWKGKVRENDSIDFHYDYLLAQVYARKSDFKKSEKYYVRSLDKIEKKNSKNSYPYLFVLSDKAYKEYLINNYNVANKLYETILEGLDRLGKNNTPFYYQDLKRYSNSLSSSKQAGKATALIKNYLSDFTAKDSNDSINQVILYEQLGRLYFRENQYDQSISILKNAYSMLQESQFKNHWIGTEILLYLAYCYSDLNNIDSSRLYFGKSISFAENRNDTTSYNYFYNHIYLAQSYHNTGELDKALYHINYFLDRATRLNFDRQPIYLKAILVLADIQSTGNDYAKAYDTYEHALDLVNSEDGLDRFALIDIYNGLAFCAQYIEDKGKEEVLNYYQKSIDFQLASDYYMEHLAFTYTSLATYYISEQDWSASETTLSSLKNLLEKHSYKNDYYNISYHRKMGYFYYKKYEYEKAKQHLLAALEILETHQSQYHLLNVDLCIDIADIFEDTDKYREASKWNLRAIEILDENGYSESMKYVFVLNELAFSFYEQQLFDNALVYYNRAYNLATKLEGEASAKAIEQLNGIVATYRSMGDDEAALKALGEMKKKIDLLSLSRSVKEYLIEYYDEFGAIQLELSNNDAAEAAYLKCVELAEDLYGKDHSSYFFAVSRLASYYNIVGKVDKSQFYITQAIKWTEQKYGNASVKSAWNLGIQAKNFIAMDNYKLGLSNYELIRDIYSENFGKQSWDYISTTKELAYVLNDLGRFDDSENMFIEALNLIEESDGRINFAYIKTLQELATIYRSRNQPDKAIKLTRQGIAYLDTLNADPISYGPFYNLIGLCYSDKREIEPAKEFMYKAKSLYENQEGKVLFGYYVAVNNLGYVKLMEEEYEESERLFKLSEGRFKNKSYIGIFDRVNYENNLAALYLAWGKTEKAGEYWNGIVDKLLNKISADFSFMSENEKSKFWDAYRDDFEHYNSYVLKAYQEFPEEVGRMYNNQLKTKSILLSTSSKDRQRILNSGDTILIAEYFDYITQKEKLVKFYGYTNDQLEREKIALDSMELLVNDLEKRLNLDAFELQQEKQYFRKSWKDIQRDLDPHEAAIEIVRFRFFDKVKTDSVLYAAMILTSETKKQPELVILPNGKDLENKYLKSYQSAIKFKLDDPYSYQNYWSAIEKYLAGKEVIYFSPDGVYNQINLNTLKDRDNRYLLDKYNIVTLTSTRDIEELKNRTKKAFRNNTAYLFGFPTYSLSHDIIKEQTYERNRAFNQGIERDILLDRFGFSELPGTKTETENINELLNLSNWTTNLFLGEEALEEYVKSVRNPRVLHIATHGFFLDDVTENSELQLGVNTEVSKSNPLLRSGLLFAGAEETVKGEYDNATENGIFTAFEAMTLDLSETELVVLSACETGRGEVKSGEGVYGLQRAFQIAGTESLIMSLWKVNDAATQELMTAFYNNWIGGKSKKDAFKTAQLSVKDKFKDPYYWGAFVMVGE